MHESCLLSPHPCCVNVLCQLHLSIQYFQWENPSTFKCSWGGTRILSVTPQSFFSRDIQWILSTHTSHLNVSVYKDDFHLYQGHQCHSETQNSVFFDIQKFDIQTLKWHRFAAECHGTREYIRVKKWPHEKMWEDLVGVKANSSTFSV